MQFKTLQPMTKATRNDCFSRADSRTLAPEMILRFHCTGSFFSAKSLRFFTMTGKSLAKVSTTV